MSNPQRVQNFASSSSTNPTTTTNATVVSDQEKAALEARYAASDAVLGAPGQYLNAPSLPAYETMPNLSTEWLDQPPPQEMPPQYPPPQQNAPGTVIDPPSTINLKLAVVQFQKVNRGYRLFQTLLSIGALIAGIFSIFAAMQTTVSGYLGLWLYMVIAVVDVVFSALFLSPRHTVISADVNMRDITQKTLSKLVGYDAVMAALWVLAAIFFPDCIRATDWFCATSDAAWWLGWFLVFAHGVGLILNVQNSKRIRMALAQVTDVNGQAV